ncbi:MAG: hypothetical protein ABSH08_18850, partial [Tepidisphaeraceae bacterium]
AGNRCILKGHSQAGPSHLIEFRCHRVGQCNAQHTTLNAQRSSFRKMPKLPGICHFLHFDVER